MPSNEDTQKIRTHAVWEEAKLNLDLEWDSFDAIVAYGCEVMDRTKSLEQAYGAVDDQLQAWKDAEREAARYCKALEDRQASQLLSEQMSMQAARQSPTLAANIGQGKNATAITGAIQGVEDKRKIEEETQRKIAFLHAAREKQLDYLKRQFPNIFYNMEPNDVALPSCIAHLREELLRSVSGFLGPHRVSKFHSVSMGGGAYMCQLPHEVDYFELKLGPEICRDWLEPRADHGFSVAKIKESWEAAKRLKLEPRQTHANLAFDIGKVRLVTSPDRQCVITYFEEGYMK